MQRIIDIHRKIWHRSFFRSVALGALFLAISLVINYIAGIYATEKVSVPVTDIILSNIRVFDVDELVTYGALALIVFTLVLQIWQPKKLPFVLKSVALFIMIRSIFISLTHIGPFTDHVVLQPIKFLSGLGLGTTADLFFSGHTGMPFLLSLIYWNNKKLRILFLLTSFFLGGATLLGHLHYSIDVFSAFFITYTIFEIAKQAFPQDWIVAGS